MERSRRRIGNPEMNKTRMGIGRLIKMASLNLSVKMGYLINLWGGSLII